MIHQSQNLKHIKNINDFEKLSYLINNKIIPCATEHWDPGPSSGLLASRPLVRRQRWKIVQQVLGWRAVSTSTPKPLLSFKTGITVTNLQLPNCYPTPHDTSHRLHILAENSSLTGEAIRFERHTHARAHTHARTHVHLYPHAQTQTHTHTHSMTKTLL